MQRINNTRGATLVELLVALGVFTVFMALLFPSFTFLTQQMSTMNDQEMLNQRGDRMMNYLAEEIRMVGFLTGANPGITFCGETNVNALTHTDGDPYDSITFMTSIPIIPDAEDVPTLNLVADAVSGAGSITVNTAESNVPEKYLNDSTTAFNARALITFDTLSPTILEKVYQVTAYGGADINLSSTTTGLGLAQALNAGSQIYSVRRKEIEVNADRDLSIAEWNTGCTNAGTTDIIYPALGADDADAGIEGLQFEYLIENPNTRVVSKFGSMPPADGSMTANAARSNLKAIIIYALIRADFPSRDYTDTNSYTLGTPSNPAANIFTDPVTLSFSGDEVARTYRRVLLTKTVEVKNLVF